MNKTVNLTWVDVNERLPKKEGIVLGLSWDNLIIPAFFRISKYSGEKWFEWFESGDKAQIVFWAEEPETPNIKERIEARIKFYGRSSI